MVLVPIVKLPRGAICLAQVEWLFTPAARAGQREPALPGLSLCGHRHAAAIFPSVHFLNGGNGAAVHGIFLRSFQHRQERIQRLQLYYHLPWKDFRQVDVQSPQPIQLSLT